MKFLKSSRERALFFVVVGLLILLAAAIGGKSLLERQAFVENELFRLRSESLELRSWLADREAILSRQSWLAEHLPPLVDSRKEGLDFLESVEKRAHEIELQIMAKSILDPEKAPDWTAIPLRISTQGEFRKLVLLLYEIQQPGEFVMVREINVKPVGDSHDIITELELLKVFRAEPTKG